MARLASGQIDILPTYADARRDFADMWTTDYKQSQLSGKKQMLVYHNQFIMIQFQFPKIQKYQNLKALSSHLLIS